jgi:hypothetical protein
VEFVQAFEQARNLLPIIDHALIGEAERLDLATVYGQGNIRRVWTSALSISRAEAARRRNGRVRSAPRRSRLSAGRWPTVDRRGFDPADVDAGEELLAGQAVMLPPEDLKIVADRVVDAIDPDGTLPDEQLNHDRRFFELRPTRMGRGWGSSG